MAYPKILVTGATGKTGGAVVRQLLERGRPVRALVHRADARSERLRSAGAEVVVADLFDPEQILTALQGTNRAYYCPPFHRDMNLATTAFAIAAREVGLESVVMLSQWLASPSHPSLSSRQHWLAERAFAMLPGVTCTTLTPGFFASYPYLELIGYAAQLGLYPLPVSGETRNAPPSDEDIARVAVAALEDPAKHGGKSYRPTGPALISVNDIVATLGKVLGRRVRHVRIPLWMFLKAARLDGVDRFLLSQLPYYLQEQERDAFAFGGPTDHVLEVTGREPEDFETIARRYAALPKASRTLGNGLLAMAKFLAIPMVPGFNPAEFSRAQGLALPAAPRLVLDDPAWRASRSAIASSSASTPMKLVASA